MSCECRRCKGRFEVLDDVTQFCVEEAAHAFVDVREAVEQEEAAKKDEKPGEITDPALAAAMQAAKDAHSQNFGQQPGMSRGRS